MEDDKKFYILISIKGALLLLINYLSKNNPKQKSSVTKTPIILIKRN
jgi:uncharacterized membrane protein YcaP (DUF421 family)